MLKKIFLSVSALSLIVLGGCGDEPAPDPQELLRETFLNSFEINSSAFSAEANLKIEDIEDFSGELNFTFEGKVEDILEYKPKLDLTTNLEFSGKVPESEATGDFSFSMKLIENALFAKIGKIDFTSDDPQVEAMKPLFQMYSGKWWKISLDMLEDSSVINFEEQKAVQQEMIEAYKKLFIENDIFLIDNFSKNDDNDDYILEVRPNFDLILTQEFIENEILSTAKTMIEKSELGEEEKAEALTKLKLDKEIIAELPKIREIAKQIWTSGNFKIVIQIDPDEIIQRSSEFSGSLDLAKINELMPEEDREEDVSGKIIFNINSTSSDWNQPQNIVAPEDFIDFDPLMLFGNQMQEEVFAPTNNEWDDYKELNEMMDQERDNNAAREMTDKEVEEMQNFRPVARPQ